MLHSRQFYDIAAIKYDRYIVDKFIKGASNFELDTVGSTLCFSPRIIPDGVEICHGGSLTKGVRSTSAPRGQSSRRRRGSASPRGYSNREEIPPDFPADVCFFFNYRQCWDENCPRNHVCRKCHGKHRADGKEKCKNS